MRLFVLSLAIFAFLNNFLSVTAAAAVTAKPSATQDPARPAATTPEPGAGLPMRDPAKAGPPPAGDGTMDFDFFKDEGKAANTDSGSPQPDSSDVAAKASRRRWMLKVHQTLGITTWALMAATVTVGQLNYNQLYGGGGGSTKWQGPHKALIVSTSLAFAATGAFAIFAPDPYERPKKLDTGMVHRIAVIGATLGMITEAVLGIVTSRRADAGNPRSLKTLARAHQAVGYTTFGLLTVAGTVWVF
jgi:hypothetical protein